MEARTAAPAVTLLNEDWKKIGEIPGGGKNAAGDLSGIYQHIRTGKKYIIKQDSVYCKNIAEYVASRIQRLLNPENPDVFAKVKLFFIPGATAPNTNGSNVYVGSRYYDNSIEAWKDAYNAYNFVETYQNIRPKHLVNRPASRPRWIKNDRIVTLMLKHGRLKGLAKLIAGAGMVDNPDLNLANILAVPQPCHDQCRDNCVHKSYQTIQCHHKEEKIFDKVQAVNVDFGAALGDNRRKLDDHLHFTDAWRYLKPVSFRLFFGDGPPNYILALPDELIFEKTFTCELLKLSCFPSSVLVRGIDDIMQQIKLYYGKQPLLEFAKRIGADKYMQKEKCHFSAKTNEEELIRYITQFLQEKMCKRLLSARKNAQAIADKIKMKSEEFDSTLAALQEKMQTLFLEHEGTEYCSIPDTKAVKLEDDIGCNAEQEIINRNNDEKEKETNFHVHYSQSRYFHPLPQKDTFDQIAGILENIRLCLRDFFNTQHSALIKDSSLFTTFLFDFDPEEATGYKLALAYELLRQHERIPHLTPYLREQLGNEPAMHKLVNQIKTLLCEFYTDEKNIENFIRKNVENAFEALYQYEPDNQRFTYS